MGFKTIYHLKNLENVCGEELEKVSFNLTKLTNMPAMKPYNKKYSKLKTRERHIYVTGENSLFEFLVQDLPKKYEEGSLPIIPINIAFYRQKDGELEKMSNKTEKP